MAKQQVASRIKTKTSKQITPDTMIKKEVKKGLARMPRKRFLQVAKTDQTSIDAILKIQRLYKNSNQFYRRIAHYNIAVLRTNLLQTVSDAKSLGREDFLLIFR
jgi:hypothetical protein